MYIETVFNDRGNFNNGQIDPAFPLQPTVFLFETKDCEPVLHFDEYYNFANLLTRVRNARVIGGGLNVHAVAQATWYVSVRPTST